MLFIAHRINTIEELKTIPYEYGVEIDIRDYGDKLILQHDPYVSNNELTNFEDWLKYYNHSLLILNIKSEGIEFKVLEIIKKYNVTEYFFLDSSIPMINKLINKGENNIAIRYSEFEPIEFVSKFIGKFKWVWIDCFTHYPNILPILKKEFNTCIVGPTLQGHNWDIKEEWKNVCAVCDKKYNYKKWIN